MLRPQSRQGRFAAERLPKFEFGSLGKRSTLLERWQRSRTCRTFLTFHFIYIYRYFANKQLFFLIVNTLIH